jgi:hypothetical protein
VADEAKASYKGNFEGIGKMLRSDEMLEAMLKKAELVKAVAEDIAAVSPTGSQLSPSGAYKKSFKVFGRKDGGKHNDRAQATVSSNDPVAVFVEFGTVNMRGDHTLLRALFEGLRK